MIAVWIILGIVVYLIIGSVLASLFGDEDLYASLLAAWPIVLVFFVGGYLVAGLLALGDIIASRIRKFFKS